MKLNNKLILSILISILTINIAYSINPQIDITENISIYDKHTTIDIDCDGTIQIYNPSQKDEIYETIIELKSLSTITITKTTQATNTTNTLNKLELSQNKITTRTILPNQTLTLNYNIQGSLIQTYKQEIEQTSCLNYLINEVKLSPMRYVTLSKLQRENQSTNISARKILVQGTNPTDYDVNIKYLDVFKTSAINWTNLTQNKPKLHSTYNLSLAPKQLFNIGVLDPSSTDLDVYWLEYNIYTINNITNTIQNKTIKYKSSTGGSKDNQDNDETNANNQTNQDNQDNDDQDNLNNPEKSGIKIIKTSNQSTIKPNQTVEITIKITNNANKKITNLKLTETLPKYLQFNSLDNNYQFQSSNPNQPQKQTLTIPIINPKETITIKYQLTHNQTIQTDTIYIQPTTIEYDNKIAYSNELTLINYNYDNEEKIHIEKKIETLENDTTRVTIIVKNVGSIDVNNIIIVESIIPPVKKITPQYNDYDLNNYPAPNNYLRWKIETLRIGEEWEVAYDIPSINITKQIPEVFGVDDGIVYKTLYLDEEIIVSYQQSENIGLKFFLLLAVILIVIDVLF